MKNRPNVVFLGGIETGKTTAIQRIVQEFTEKGYNVLVINEAATELINGGIRRFGDNAIDMVEFQKYVLDLQIAKEVDYLILHFNLKPKILVYYDRESYKGEDNLRITFDENLKYGHQNLSFIKGKRDKIYFKDKRNVIMEVKTHGIIPLWLAEIMSVEKIYPQQFSKIGKVYEKIRKENNV